MTDPVSDLVVCRDALDVLERQAKAATEGEWQAAHAAHESEWFVGVETRPGSGRYTTIAENVLTQDDARFIAMCSPAAVLALCGWIRQTLDGAESALRLHQMNNVPSFRCCGRCSHKWPCSDHERAASVIAGLAAVLAPDRPVKP